MTWTPRRRATFPIAGIGVGWMSSRKQAELQKKRVTNGSLRWKTARTWLIQALTVPRGDACATERGMIGPSDFPRALPLVGVSSRFRRAPPHIQLSYETNPFGASASTIVHAARARTCRLLALQRRWESLRVMKDQFHVVVLNTRIDSLPLCTARAARIRSAHSDPIASDSCCPDRPRSPGPGSDRH